MLDPEEVTSPVIAALDRALDHYRQGNEILREVRAVEFTRTYHKLRKQRIRSGAPTRNPRDDEAA